MTAGNRDREITETRGGYVTTVSVPSFGNDGRQALSSPKPEPEPEQEAEA
jgi:hypothetical protein